jgi:thiol-disulfide isomerase/thioredoxin
MMPELCDKCEVSAFPTLFLYRDGEFMEEMWRARAKDDVIAYAKEKVTFYKAAYSKKVTFLHGKTFDETIQKGRWLINFYPGKCVQGCVDFAANFVQVAETLSVSTGAGKESLHFGNVNCESDGGESRISNIEIQLSDLGLCKRLKIEKYPTVRLYWNGALEDTIPSPEKMKAKEFQDYVQSRQKSETTVPNPEGTITKLEAATFEKVTANGPWIVEFYSPMCGACKAFAPTYEKLGKLLQGKVNVGALDCTRDKQMTDKYGIKGFPTIK